MHSLHPILLAVLFLCSCLSATKNVLRPNFNPYCSTKFKCRTVCSCELFTNCSLLPMDETTRNSILYYHNQIRDIQSSAEPQPAGLTLLEYDSDLEGLSRCWAGRCSNEYSDCFLTPKFNETSQSVVQLILEGGGTPSTFLWMQMMSYWLKQANSISAEAFSALPTGKEYEFVHNFAQLMSDKILFIGCAWSVMDNLLTFVCTYGPRGPNPRERIYRMGKYCSLCPKKYQCNYRKPFERLCKKKRELRANESYAIPTQTTPLKRSTTTSKYHAIKYHRSRGKFPPTTKQTIQTTRISTSTTTTTSYITFPKKDVTKSTTSRSTRTSIDPDLLTFPLGDFEIWPFAQITPRPSEPSTSQTSPATTTSTTVRAQTLPMTQTEPQTSGPSFSVSNLPPTPNYPTISSTVDPEIPTWFIEPETSDSPSPQTMPPSSSPYYSTFSLMDESEIPQEIPLQRARLDTEEVENLYFTTPFAVETESSIYWDIQTQEEFKTEPPYPTTLIQQPFFQTTTEYSSNDYPDEFLEETPSSQPTDNDEYPLSSTTGNPSEPVTIETEVLQSECSTENILTELRFVTPPLLPKHPQFTGYVTETDETTTLTTLTTDKESSHSETTTANTEEGLKKGGNISRTANEDSEATSTGTLVTILCIGIVFIIIGTGFFMLVMYTLRMGTIE